MDPQTGNLTVPITVPKEQNQLDTNDDPAALESKFEQSKEERFEAENEAKPGETNGEVEEAQYLTGVPLVMMTFALMAGVFMIALDNSIICEPKIHFLAFFIIFPFSLIRTC
jgi:hypothetical protein